MQTRNQCEGMDDGNSAAPAARERERYTMYGNSRSIDFAGVCILLFEIS